MLAQETIQSFLEKVALQPSTPAGGSIAALNAASAAALAEMTANLTIKKLTAEEKVREMKNMSKLCSEFRIKFMAGMDQDAEAFENVLAAFRLPTGNDKPCKSKDERISESCKNSVLILLAMAKDALELMQLIKSEFGKAGDQFITDIAQAYMLAETALRSFIHHMEANFIHIRDVEFTYSISYTLDTFKSALKCPS